MKNSFGIFPKDSQVLAFRAGVDDTPDWFYQEKTKGLADIINYEFSIQTVFGKVPVKRGEYIVKDVRGTFLQSMRYQIFHKYYLVVEGVKNWKPQIN